MESNNNEIWKDIKNYEGFYKISNTGKVLGVKRDKVKKCGKGRIYLCG